MYKWYERFRYNKKYRLKIGDKIYQASDLKHIASGSEKHVWKIINEKTCFLIPNKCNGEKEWNYKIGEEKNRCDQLAKLGMKAQRYEIIPLEIEADNEETYTLNALVTTDLNALCQDENLVICDYKSDQRVFGNVPDLHALLPRFKDKTFVQRMFAQIVQELATAVVFNLPISALQGVDDSQHICFELANDIPVVRYMFWDVLSDTGEATFIPNMVPTLDEFRAKSRSSLANALSSMVNLAVCAFDEVLKRTKHISPDESLVRIRQLEKDVLAAIDEADYLNAALEHVSQQASDWVKELLNNKDFPQRIPDNEGFIFLLEIAISSNDINAVHQVCQRRPDTALTEKEIDDVLAIAEKYKSAEVINDLTRFFQPDDKKVFALTKKDAAKKKNIAQLKAHFLAKYSFQLESDQNSWCGLYSFFAKSYVDKNASLEEIVKHAQGLSGKGTGERSRSVMRHLGWLDENNEIDGDLAEALMDDREGNENGLSF